MFQMYTAFPFLARVAPALHILAICVFVLYFPGGPFMIMTMFGQRAGANKVRGHARGFRATPTCSPSHTMDATPCRSATLARRPSLASCGPSPTPPRTCAPPP